MFAALVLDGCSYYVKGCNIVLNCVDVYKHDVFDLFATLLKDKKEYLDETKKAWL